MTAPFGSYGAASQARSDAFDAVMQGNQGTSIKAIIYVNNQRLTESGVFTSSTRPPQNSRYAMRNNPSLDMRLSRNDAEVGALDWAYDQAVALRNAGRNVQSFQVDLVANRGTCNGCKVRQRALAGDLAGLFPSARRPDGTWKIAVVPNYDNGQNESAVDGRVNLQSGELLSTNGYNDARLRSNSVTQAAGGQSLYWQYRQYPFQPAGIVPPGQVDHRERTTPPLSDGGSPDWSPHGSTGGTPPRSTTPPGNPPPRPAPVPVTNPWQTVPSRRSGQVTGPERPGPGSSSTSRAAQGGGGARADSRRSDGGRRSGAAYDWQNAQRRGGGRSAGTR